jgi:hypothetical protein
MTAVEVFVEQMKTPLRMNAHGRFSHGDSVFDADAEAGAAGFGRHQSDSAESSRRGCEYTASIPGIGWSH